MLLVTNDFPPKVGGIQNYLYELWKRLPCETRVITTKYKNTEEFDTQQSFRIDRVSKVLLPNPVLKQTIIKAVEEMKTDVVFFDPLLPLGQLIPSISKKYDVNCIPILHGAEITVPGFFPGSKNIARRILKHSKGVVAAGNYVADIADRAAGYELNKVIIPPGVDCIEFNPNNKKESRDFIIEKHGIPADAFIISSISRVVPRKGFDYLIESIACEELRDVHVIVLGDGRDMGRLQKLAKKLGVESRVVFTGKVPFEDLKKYYKGCDIFSMLCRDRWRSLEAEGFGIVFLEASASGVPVIGGISGGSTDAIDHGKSGFLVESTNIEAIREKILLYLKNPELVKKHGESGRNFAKNNFDYDELAKELLPVVLNQAF